MVGRRARSHGPSPSQPVACLSGPALLMAGLGPYMTFLSVRPVLSVAGQHAGHHRWQRKRPRRCARINKLRPGRQWPRSRPSGCQRHQSLACMPEVQNPYGRLNNVRSPCGRRGPFQVVRSRCSLWRMAQGRCWEGSHRLPLYPSCICMHIPSHQVTRYLVDQGVEWWVCWG